MSESRWTWNSFKNWVYSFSDTPCAQGAYSVGAGLVASSSVAYVGSLLSYCFPPALTCCWASTTCITTSAIRYKQISSNDGRVGKLEQNERDSEERIRRLEATCQALEVRNSELSCSAQMQYEMLKNIIPTLSDSQQKENCERLLTMTPDEIKKNANDRYLLPLEISTHPSTLFNFSPRYQPDATERNADDALSRSVDEINDNDQLEVEDDQENNRVHQPLL